MKINFVYEFSSCYNTIVNGISPRYLEKLFYNDFDFAKCNIHQFNKSINHNISFWKTAYLYGWDDSEDFVVKDIININENELYLYPLSTSGDLLEFLSLRDVKHKTAFYYISEKTKKLLTNDNFYIYIEHAGEPAFDSSYLKEIYELCIDNNIPFHKILLVNGSNSNNIILDDFKEKYDIKLTCKLSSYNWPLPLKSGEIRKVLGIDNENQSDNSTLCTINHIYNVKEKPALLLNRRLRLHRLVFLSLLFNNGDINSTLYSLDTSLNLYDDFDEILNDRPNTLPIDIPINYRNNILNGYKLLSESKKSTLDYDNLKNVHGYGMETKELYEKTSFSIVTETEFSYFQQAITEKSIKPIMHCHPFIILGSPNSLKLLKEYGFKTFDKWWDESYDDEIDDFKRMNMVVSLLHQLFKKSNDEFQTMLIEMKDVLEFNKNNLLKFNKKFILNELKKNMKNVLTSDVSKLL